ncbi:Arc family DNA-binding protein [Massilia sp. X63]|uniref:Arc family DNA-binding protein n=1 Tax=Massilia sp. X63 TaxID=3237285 RepID=UPI0034DD9FBB
MTKPKTTRPPTAHITPFGLRMQPELKERLEAAAQEAGRSLNAEIVARLEQSFEPRQTMILIDEFENMLHGVLAEIKKAQ